MPARFIAGTKKSTPSSGDVVARATEPVQHCGAAQSLDQARHQEERGLHRDVVGDIDGRGDAGLAHQANAEEHETDVRDQGEGEHALDARLGDGAEDADNHRHQARDRDHPVHDGIAEKQRLHAQDGIDADLGQQAGEDGADRRGAEG